MNEYQDLLNFGDCKVLVFGDLMLDRYLIGNVERESPEAPVPILLQDSFDERPGGAANVAMNIHSLGAQVIIAGAIGSDAAGSTLIDRLSKAGIDCKSIITVKDRPTTTKTRIMQSSNHLLRVDRESTNPLLDQDRSKLVSIVLRLLEEENIDLLLFQDYDKGVLTNNTIQPLLDYCKRNSIITGADPKISNFFEYKGVDFFKPNLKELHHALDFNNQNLEEIMSACETLYRSNNSKFVMVTLSDKGLVIVEQGKAVHFPVEAIDDPDVCGAGDAVFALVSLLLKKGASATLIGSIANAAGVQICEKPGVVPLDKEALIKSMT